MPRPAKVQPAAADSVLDALHAGQDQADAVLRAGKSLDAALTSLRQGMTPDAVLVDVEAAMSALGEVTGRTMREDITNRIFERFCVGK